MKLGILPQLERVDLAVIRDGMAFREPWNHLGRIVDPAVEPVIEIEARGGAGRVENGVRIEIVVRAVVRVDELAAGLRQNSLDRERR